MDKKDIRSVRMLGLLAIIISGYFVFWGLLPFLLAVEGLVLGKEIVTISYENIDWIFIISMILLFLLFISGIGILKWKKWAPGLFISVVGSDLLLSVAIRATTQETCPFLILGIIMMVLIDLGFVIAYVKVLRRRAVREMFLNRQ